MTESPNDKQLKAEFRQLREIEMRAAPGYREPLTSPVQATAGKPFRPVMFAMVAAVVVVMTMLFLKTGHDQPLPEMAEKTLPILLEEDRIANLEMPTDFLLDTPWFDLARTTPDFDFEFPHYDLPEERSDEI